MTFKRIAGNTWKTLIWPVAIYVLFLVLCKIFSPQAAFGTWKSIDGVIKQAILGALIAMAMACNMINDRWDFSMGIICVCSSFIATPIAKALSAGILENDKRSTGPSWILLLLCIVICMLLCLINAVLYLVIKVPALVISIGVMLIYETLVRIVNGGNGARLSGINYTLFGRSPWIYILAVAVFLIFAVIYTFTKFGYNVRSLGNNQQIANNIGVNETKNVILSYLLCGFILGVAACVNVGLKGSIEASSTFNNNMGMMFQAFPAVFIGLYLSRYTNFTVGIFIGAFCIKLMTAGVLALGLPSAVQDIGVGAFLFFFIALTTNQGRFLDKSARKAAMKIARAENK
ncbi:MAG: hypothetical protein HUJ76_00290 [Parasporobacterium sp.]|nr:hypothetical protein [Parasporobacterium sp.]